MSDLPNGRSGRTDPGNQPIVQLAHGEGGRWMRRLIREHIATALDNPRLAPLSDGARLGAVDGELVVTTDSYVVRPLFFPGGDIGTLAVYGTCNDLAVCGAIPRWLSLAMIVEEGLPIALLDRILERIARAAAQAGVEVVTGDTKVVEKGAADGLYLNTTGVGVLVEPAPPGPSGLQEGDRLIVSAPLGRHGIAVLAAREQLGFEPAPQSDCASIFPAIEALRAAGIVPRSLRDATRGGLAAVLHEWARDCRQTLEIEQSALPIDEMVRSACELLGLDPVHVANEGMFVAAVAEEDAERALAALRAVPVSAQAAIVGVVTPPQAAAVVIRRLAGAAVAVDEPAGALLPRIC